MSWRAATGFSVSTFFLKPTSGTRFHSSGLFFPKASLTLMDVFLPYSSLMESSTEKYWMLADYCRSDQDRDLGEHENVHFFIIVQVLAFWRRNYFFNFSTHCI